MAKKNEKYKFSEFFLSENLRNIKDIARLVLKEDVSTTVNDICHDILDDKEYTKTQVRQDLSRLNTALTGIVKSWRGQIREAKTDLVF